MREEEERAARRGKRNEIVKEDAGNTQRGTGMHINIKGQPVGHP